MKQKQFADSKNISVKSLNKLINEFKDVPKFGKIDLSNTTSTAAQKQISKRTIQFSCENIKIELKEGYNKVFLRVNAQSNRVTI